MANENRVSNGLFLCTGNSAGSTIAECVLDRLGRGRFRALSAGSMPTGEVNPFAGHLPRNTNHEVDEPRSKSRDEF